jgi:hypothetical protein
MTPDDVLGKFINHEILVEEAQHVKNLSKGIISARKQDIVFKASKKSKSKKVVEESTSEEEGEDDSDDESTGYDSKEMAHFIRRLSKMMGKQKFFKGDKKDKFRSKTKRAYYNCGKYGHYIANCPYERREEEDDKKKKKKERSYKNDKHYKKKTYDEAHIDKEWDSDDESSDSDSDGVTTVAIKGSSSSRKSLFPNLNKGKHTCLMVKESKRKVKSKSTPPKYVSSDDEVDSSDEEEDALLNVMCKNPKERIKGLLKEVGICDELLDQQEKLLVQEKESNQELKKLLKLEKEKNKKLDQELVQSKETISSLKSSSGALPDSYDVLQKTHKNLEV